MRLVLYPANREQVELWDIGALYGMNVLRDEEYLIILPGHLKSRSKICRADLPVSLELGQAVSLTRTGNKKAPLISRESIVDAPDLTLV
jgi:hypothetical protein